MVHNKTVTLRRTLNFRKLVTTLPEMALWKKPSLREHSNSLLITSPFSTPKLHHRSLNICHEFASFLSLPFESCPNSIRSLLPLFQNYHFFIILLLQTVQRSKGKYYFYYSSTWNLQTWLRLNLRRLTPRHFPSSILKIGRPLPVNYISPGLSRGICPPILASWHFNQRLKGRFFFSPRCYRTRPTSFMYAQCISEEASRHTSAITSLDKATAYFPLATRLHLQANEIPFPSNR